MRAAPVGSHDLTGAILSVARLADRPILFFPGLRHRKGYNMAKRNGTPLRFAALVRVSTERQEKQGESVRAQQSQIESTI